MRKWNAVVEVGFGLGLGLEWTWTWTWVWLVWLDNYETWTYFEWDCRAGWVCGCGKGGIGMWNGAGVDDGFGLSRSERVDWPLLNSKSSIGR